MTEEPRGKCRWCDFTWEKGDAGLAFYRHFAEMYKEGDPAHKRVLLV